MKRRVYIGLFAALILVYLGLNLLISPDKTSLAHYHLSSAGARAITYSVVIPISLIYVIGAYGSLTMKGYSQLIRSSKEGRSLNTISNGLLVLVLSQVLVADLGSVVSLILRHNPTWAEPLTIIDNYLVVLLTGVGLVVIAAGAWRLSGLVRHRVGGYEQGIFTLLFIGLSSFYSFFIIHQPIHTPLGRRLYFMPDWLIVLSLAIPYLFFWYLGFFGAYSIYGYQKNVKGSIYKGSLSYVAAGIAMVVVSSMAVRFITTISTKLSRLSITPVLFIVYGFLVLLAIGFLLIAWGAKKLRRIEEV